MRVLWFTWKDLEHPEAGGAEVMNEAFAARLVADGHEVIMVVGGFKGAVPEVTVNGYRLVRLGNRYTLYWQAYRYYKRHLRDWPDLIIEEVNTVPFFTALYARQRRIMLFYQLAREIWFYQMVFPLSLVGYILEPLYLRLLRRERVLTISESSRQDLCRHGFSRQAIDIFPIGIQLKPVPALDRVSKYRRPTLLSLGAIRPMKRTHHQLKAFELAKQQLPALQLKVAGDASGAYGKKVLGLIRSSPFASDIEYLGRVDRTTKIELMQRSHAIVVTSVKEGWGLIVTEAASQGTPAVVYDVDGLRDSTLDGTIGIVSKADPRSLAAAIASLFQDKGKYDKIRRKGWEFGKTADMDRSYVQFKRFIEDTKT